MYSSSASPGRIAYSCIVFFVTILRLIIQTPVHGDVNPQRIFGILRKLGDDVCNLANRCLVTMLTLMILDHVLCPLVLIKRPERFFCLFDVILLTLRFLLTADLRHINLWILVPQKCGLPTANRFQFLVISLYLI